MYQNAIVLIPGNAVALGQIDDPHVSPCVAGPVQDVRPWTGPNSGAVNACSMVVRDGVAHQIADDDGATLAVSHASSYGYSCCVIRAVANAVAGYYIALNQPHGDGVATGGIDIRAETSPDIQTIVPVGAYGIIADGSDSHIVVDRAFISPADGYTVIEVGRIAVAVDGIYGHHVVAAAVPSSAHKDSITSCIADRVSVNFSAQRISTGSITSADVNAVPNINIAHNIILNIHRDSITPRSAWSVGADEYSVPGMVIHSVPFNEQVHKGITAGAAG